jgi:hypothetical protein
LGSENICFDGKDFREQITDDFRVIRGYLAAAPSAEVRFPPFFARTVGRPGKAAQGRGRSP